CSRSSANHGKRPGESGANTRDRSSKYFIVGQRDRYAHLYLTAARPRLYSPLRQTLHRDASRQGTGVFTIVAELWGAMWDLQAGTRAILIDHALLMHPRSPRQPSPQPAHLPE